MVFYYFYYILDCMIKFAILSGKGGVGKSTFAASFEFLSFIKVTHINSRFRSCRPFNFFYFPIEGENNFIEGRTPPNNL